jgi:hypothetical protein
MSPVKYECLAGFILVYDPLWCAAVALLARLYLAGAMTALYLPFSHSLAILLSPL